MTIVDLSRYSPRNLGIEPYVYLIWLVFLVAQPIFDPTTTWVDWAFIPVIVAVFLPVYLNAWTGTMRTRIISIVAMCVLGLLAVTVNSGAGSFFIYAASAAAFVLQPRQAVLAVVAIVGLVLVSGFLVGAPWPYALFYVGPMTLMTGLIGGINIFEAEKERASKRLSQANDEIERLAKIAERERIARDLHDLLGHTLSTITLKSELAARLAQVDIDKAAQQMREVETISRETLSQVREAVRGYRSKGLQAEIDALSAALQPAGIELTVEREPVELQPEQESTLALALREAVTNVMRHSHASHCKVSLYNEDDWIVLRVEDNGRGSREPEGNGLRGMRERLQALGGSLERHSNGGTVLLVRLPRARPVPAPEPALKAAEASGELLPVDSERLLQLADLQITARPAREGEPT